MKYFNEKMFFILKSCSQTIVKSCGAGSLNFHGPHAI